MCPEVTVEEANKEAVTNSVGVEEVEAKSGEGADSPEEKLLKIGKINKTNYVKFSIIV